MRCSSPVGASKARGAAESGTHLRESRDGDDLVVMVGQQKRLSQPLSTPRAGKIAAVAVAASLLAALLAVLVIASTGGSARGAGCIEVTLASTLGGTVTHACGAHAREICAAPAETPLLAAHGVLREACGRAGLPYGSR
jgi:hypothetical protein